MKKHPESVNRTANTTTEAEEKDIVNEAKDFVTRLLTEELSSHHVYHNYTHTRETVEACEEIASATDLPEQEKEDLLIAAWFHDTGYTQVYTGHEAESVKFAERFLKEQSYPEERIDRVRKIILSTQQDQKPEDLAEKIIHDADNLHIGKKRFFRRGELLRTEFEHFLDLHYSNKEWEKIQFNFLQKTDFYTLYAKNEYGGRRAKNLAKQRKAKTQRTKLGRGIETMYRTAYDNHISLSSIADAKANMMISINTIIMSIIVTLMSTGFTFFSDTSLEHVRYTLPILALLVGSTISLVFAILSARPNVTHVNVDKEKLYSRQSSILFFGNFVSLLREEFVKRLSTFRKNENMLYDNMSVDLYFLGLVLHKKYRLVRISYNIFMGSLIICVSLFIAIFLYSEFSN
ncbi:MAG: Pycsar system effector family protein [Bacteroidia bacterium]